MGLAAQRFEIEAFGVREGFVVKSWYQDIQTGGGADALLLRPGRQRTLSLIPDSALIIKEFSGRGDWI